MATPLTPDQFVNALRAEGLRVVLVGSWRTHNRNHKGAWGPVHGTMTHHTAGWSSGAVEFCYEGDSDLPGPLCHGVITKDGTVHVISVGRSNHAGGGDPNVLAAVRDERYGDRPPKSQRGNSNGVDGNAHFYGWECVNRGDGVDPWPAVQVEAMVRANAALDRAHQWSEKSSITHEEWSSDKRDPRGPGFPGPVEFRARIKERLAHAANWNPNVPDNPVPPQTGTPMTKPNRLLVQRVENLTLLKDIPQTIYWTTEYPDDGQQHGDGGKTVGSNVVYDGVLNVRLTALQLNDVIEIVAAEEDANGDLLGESAMRHQIQGRFEGFHPVQESVPVSGHVANRLVFRIVSRAQEPITVEELWLSLHSWPLS